MKKLNKILVISFLFVVSIIFGDMVRKVYMPSYEVSEDISIYQVDTLTLKNQGVIQIQKFDGKKTVTISFEDFKYILKHRKGIVENLEALFERMN